MDNNELDIIATSQDRPRPRSTPEGPSRRRRRGCNPLPLLLLILIIAGVVFALIFITKNKKHPDSSNTVGPTTKQEATEAVATVPETTVSIQEQLLMAADSYAVQYDYDNAIAVLDSEPSVASDSEISAARSRYTEARDACVSVEPTQVTHIFFHSLIVDTDRAFDGDQKSTGYNQVMTTVTEFRRILDQMYARGYVLVSLHDVSYEIYDEESQTHRMLYGDIRLPEDKKPFIMSQDDVCYYEYQIRDGLASRMIIGEDGRPTCEYKDADGNVSVGEYDLVPILDAFIDEHPDFSYKGAKAALAFTGYNGILGYRTDETYDPNSSYYDSSLADSPNENIAADRAAAVEVLKALVADGYELASHSWGHLDMGEISVERFRTDCERWDRNVNSLIKEATGAPCDILIYPKGADIGSWKGYKEAHINVDGKHPDGYEKYLILHQLGFRYFCNVDSAQYFVQKGNDYFRMGRRNVDGDRMWRDIANPDRAKLSDIIDVQSVFDAARPTPVPGY